MRPLKMECAIVFCVVIRFTFCCDTIAIRQSENWLWCELVDAFWFCFLCILWKCIYLDMNVITNKWVCQKICVYFRRPDTTMNAHQRTKKWNKMKWRKFIRILSHPYFIFIEINRIRMVWLCWRKIFHKNSLNHFDWKTYADAIETSDWNSWTTRWIVSIQRKMNTICHGKFPIVNVWLIGWLLMVVS